MRLTTPGDNHGTDLLSHELKEVSRNLARLLSQLKLFCSENTESEDLDEAWYEFTSWMEPFYFSPCLEESIFFPWFAIIWKSRNKIPPPTETLLQTFLQARQNTLSDTEKDLLYRIQEQRPTFFEVHRCPKSPDLRMKNIFSGESWNVIEMGKTQHLNDQCLAFAFLLPLECGSALVVGCSPQLPHRFLEALTTSENLSIAPKNIPSSNLFDEFSSEILELYDEVLRDIRFRSPL